MNFTCIYVYTQHVTLSEYVTTFTCLILLLQLYQLLSTYYFYTRTVVMSAAHRDCLQPTLTSGAGARAGEWRRHGPSGEPGPQRCWRERDHYDEWEIMIIHN